MGDDITFGTMADWGANPVRATTDILGSIFDWNTDSNLFNTLDSADFFRGLTEQATDNAWDANTLGLDNFGLTGDTYAGPDDSAFGDSTLGGILDNMFGFQGVTEEDEEDEGSSFDDAIARAYSSRKNSGSDENDTLTESEDDEGWFTSLLG